MKTYILILATIFSSFTFSSCNNDDDNQVPIIEEPNHPIVKEWSLITRNAAWNPTYTFEENDVVWTFNNQNQVIIDINMDVTEQELISMLYPFHQSGTYQYVINQTTNEISFTLDYIQAGYVYTLPFIINENDMTMGQLLPDDGGVEMKFKMNL
jgi:hypothetical protein